MHSRSLAGLALATVGLLALLALPACSSDEGGGGASPGKTKDAGTIAVDVTSLPDAASPVVAFDPYACPGGHLCACSSDVACLSGFCIGLADNKVCAEPCGQGCASPMVCKWLDKGGTGHAICVPPTDRLCNPCQASSDCQVYGHGDAACVDHGPAGRFCGAACTGDAGCVEGYVCRPVPVIEGGDSLQCVPKAADGAAADAIGVCTCSQAAMDQGLSTACYNLAGAGARCWGQRSCGAEGLSDCDAATAKAETCDGVDQDCDGQTDEDTCADGEPCTADACAGKDGCENTPTDGPCNADDSICTAADTCKDGACAAGIALDCDDGNGCTKDSCDKAKGCQHANDPAGPCDDGLACTEGDGCVAGSCVAGALKVCNDKQACTLDGCDEATGQCNFSWTQGLPCDDGDACTHTDLCGESKGCAGVTVSCDDGDPCSTDQCNKLKGCQHTVLPSGTDCEDGVPCTEQGKCQGGKCVPGEAKVCTASKVCWTATCSPVTDECVEAVSATGSGCDDGDACTEGDSCAGSQCQGAKATCDDNKPCTNDTCEPLSGCKAAPRPNLSACDDGDKCTTGDLCDGGVCHAGLALECDDSDPCTVDSCDKAKGCVKAPAKDGIACDDGDGDTGPDTCEAGKCKSGPDLNKCKGSGDCDDKDVCTDDVCNLTSGVCSHPVNIDGPCDDDDVCTIGEKCGKKDDKAACLPASVTNCDDANACTTDTCDAKTGCLNKAAAEGTDCDDGAKCTPADKCASGKCVAGKPVECSEKQPCQTNACDAQTGLCAFTPQKVGDLCDDDSVCSIGTKCEDVDGKLTCKGGTTDDCEDNNPCTKDSASCDPQNGCSHDPQAASCSDGKECTQGDACKDGKCEGQVKACDDKNTCTTDSCDEAKGGCQHDAIADGLDCNDDDECTTKDLCTSGKCAGTLAPGAVSRLAGSTPGKTNGTGSGASFTLPRGLAADAAGDLWVVDAGIHQVRKVTPAGVVTTIAGLGLAGFGDGAGLSARFRGPTGIGFDGAGNAYVADRDNHRIRKITADGTVSTLAGDADLGTPVGAYAEGKGTAAKFSAPTGIVWSKAYDVLYVADQANNRVRKVELDGTVSTWAGSGVGGGKDGTGNAAEFNKPTGLAIDAAGNNLYVSEQGGHRIRKIDLTGVVTTVAGSGIGGLSDAKGVLAQFSSPWGMALDVNGDLLVADSGNFRVRRITLADGDVTTYAGKGQGKDDGSALEALFIGPTGIVADGKGNSYLTDADVNTPWIRKIADPAKACAAKKVD